MNKWPDLEHRRQRLRLRNFDYSDPNYVYFLTLCAGRAQQPFANDALAQAVVEALLFRRRQGALRLYVYCLIPDHLHLAISPCPGHGTVSKLIQGFKSYTTRLAWQHWIQGKLWQRSFYDHIARHSEDLLAVCRYILANPVRRGLVETPEDWPYSGMIDPLPW